MLRKLVKIKSDGKTISFLILLIFVSTICFADFTIDMPSENNVSVDSTDFIYDSQVYNISYTGPGETLTVDTGVMNLPMKWYWIWCDDFLGLCHQPGWPATFDVEDGDEINIYYSVIMDTTAGSFSFYFKYTAPSIVDSIRCDFDFTATNTAVDEQNSHANLVKSYPNPFTNSTKIVYNKKGIIQDHVKISIFNIKGEIVKTLNSSASENEIVWNGRDRYNNEVTNGIYFYEINTKNGKIINKILKLK